MNNEITIQEIENTMSALFPHGAGQTNHIRVKAALDKIAQVAYREGRNDVLMGLMTVSDIADHFQISERRARALIANRHERFSVGMQVGNQWLIHRDELPNLQPDEKYRR